MKTTLEQFIKDTLFENVMSSGGMDGWSNYSGHNYSGWLIGPMKTRDSDALSRSNFRVALDLLGGEQEDKVEVRSVNHWACGYFYQIMVKCNTDNLDAIQKLYNMHLKLEDYPVLDEDDWSQEETDESEETIENNITSFVREICDYIGIDRDLNERNKKRMESLASEVYYEAVGHYGLENAWVSKQSIERFIEQYNNGYTRFNDKKLIKTLEYYGN